MVNFHCYVSLPEGIWFIWWHPPFSNLSDTCHPSCHILIFFSPSSIIYFTCSTTVLRQIGWSHAGDTECLKYRAITYNNILSQFECGKANAISHPLLISCIMGMYILIIVRRRPKWLDPGRGPKVRNRPKTTQKQMTRTSPRMIRWSQMCNLHQSAICLPYLPSPWNYPLRLAILTARPA